MDVKRFRADWVGRPPAVGARVIFPPETLIEDWDLTTGGGKSFVPKRIHAIHDRVGIVQRIVERGADVEVMAEDEHPRPVDVAIILSVTGPRLLARPAAVFMLLDFMAGVRLDTDEQRTAVMEQSVGWLRRLFPDLAHLREVPHFESVAEYRAYVKGVRAVTGSTRQVPGCPIRFALPSLTVDTTRLIVRPDVTNRLWGNGMAN